MKEDEGEQRQAQEDDNGPKIKMGRIGKKGRKPDAQG
jgi:hypothetical protein